MKARIVINWKTTIAGLTTGVPLIITGVTTKDWSLVVSGASAILLGILAKDVE